jgi:hypothetical protein
MMSVAQEFTTKNTLANWTRGFAQRTLPVCATPMLEEVRQAITTFLPQKLSEIPTDATAEQLLEQGLGIEVIVQYGRERIGWIATTDANQAAAFLALYSTDPYSKARHALGIDGYWILLGDPQYLNDYSTDELMNGEPYPLEMYERYPDMLRIEDRKESVVIEL